VYFDRNTLLAAAFFAQKGSLSADRAMCGGKLLNVDFAPTPNGSLQLAPDNSNTWSHVDPDQAAGNRIFANLKPVKRRAFR
jgi:hypothetical protein